MLFKILARKKNYRNIQTDSNNEQMLEEALSLTILIYLQTVSMRSVNEEIIQT